MSTQTHGLTYAEAGATGYLPLPDGYNHLRYRVRLGEVDVDRAGDLIDTFVMHRTAGVRIETTAVRAEPGVRLTALVGVGPLRLRGPCEVVTVFSGAERGFAYGTLTGHPEIGEEAFIVTREPDGVWFEVRAFSRPARWYTRAAGPTVKIFQRLYAYQLGRALRRAAPGLMLQRNRAPGPARDHVRSARSQLLNE